MKLAPLLPENSSKTPLKELESASPSFLKTVTSLGHHAKRLPRVRESFPSSTPPPRKYSHLVVLPMCTSLLGQQCGRNWRCILAWYVRKTFVFLSQPRELFAPHNRSYPLATLCKSSSRCPPPGVACLSGRRTLRYGQGKSIINGDLVTG